ncbi:hypothetical protein BDB00DRAFT_818958 [Zychaea mexicana]|uniref:uncharacterized protein n=1 Tax=Zychaea mexicana TaxID=64656 RepID=UPI0022FEEFCE|nr:uncharacterized protein BDB00DRAFT_818958 [Zychaea mexicana]KAI9494381.1 hypothetical protein BDB00DRAFT_818958 [Zychaea mexicana]
MQSYAEVYQRYFDSDRFAPGSPKTMQKELPRASAYEALISLKKKYHDDSKIPLDVNDLPTSAPLFDNNELLDRAEQMATDWTHQHPGGATAALQPETVQDETRREAQNLWSMWTANHVKQQQQKLAEPEQHAQEPRRASDSVVKTAIAGGVGGAGAGAVTSAILHDQKSGNDNESTTPRGSSMPTASEMQSNKAGDRSMSLYDTDDGSQTTQINKDDSSSSATKPTTAAATGAGAGAAAGAVPAIACSTVPANRSVPATAPIDNDGSQAKLPVASDRPVAENENIKHYNTPLHQINQQQQNDPTTRMPAAATNDGDTAAAKAGEPPQSSARDKTTSSSVGGGASGQPRGSREPADLETENEARKEISGDHSHKAGKMAAAAAGAGASMAGPSAPVQQQQQQPQRSASSTPSQDQQRNVSFAKESKEEQTKKEEVPSKNTGGNKDHIAEQSELYSRGGLSGTQPVGKIDLKNL